MLLPLAFLLFITLVFPQKFIFVSFTVWLGFRNSNSLTQYLSTHTIVDSDHFLGWETYIPTPTTLTITLFHLLLYFFAVMPPLRQLPRRSLPSAKSGNPSSSYTQTQTSASNNNMEVAVYFHLDMLLHYHPDEEHEIPDRITEIIKKIRSDKLYGRCRWPPVTRADTADLTKVHRIKYIKMIRDLESNSQTERDNIAEKYSSIQFCEKSSQAAELAAGAVVQASLDVAEARYKHALCIVRPPGHHAMPHQPMGFCIYNNVAVAAKFLLEKTCTTKILIVDWDIHHGNGTQHAFWKDKRVLYFSVHRFDDEFYPRNTGKLYPTKDHGSENNIGEGDGIGYTVNVPWDKGGYGHSDYLAVWDHILVPIVKSFEPQIILVSAGFDSAKGDIGDCDLTPYGYYHMTKKLIESGNGKIVLALEGGYDLKTVAKCTSACLKALLGNDDMSDPELSVSKAKVPFQYTWDIIEKVREKLKAHWPILAAEIPEEVRLTRRTSKSVIRKKAVLSSTAQALKSSGEEPAYLPEERAISRKACTSISSGVEPVNLQGAVSSSRNVKKNHGFPMRIRKMLRKGKYAKFYSEDTSHYLAAVIEYLLDKVLGLAGDEAKDENMKRKHPRHVRAAVNNDEELDKLLKNVIFPITGGPEMR